MAAVKLSDIEKAKLKMDIAHLLLQHRHQAEIAAMLSTPAMEVKQQMVSYYKKKIQKEWNQQSVDLIDSAKARELARIDYLERTYWDAWERSKKPHKVKKSSKTESKGSQQTHAKLVESDLTGDTKYLLGVQWCSEQRRELLGLDSPKRMAFEGAGGGPIKIDNVRERFASKIAGMSAREQAAGTHKPAKR